MSVRLRHERIRGWVDPALAYSELFGASAYAFWLDRGVGADSGTSHMGHAAPGTSIVTASVRDGTVRRRDAQAATCRTSHESVFDFLRGQLQIGQRDDPPSGFRPGWVGWLGYELAAQTCGVPTKVSRYPDAGLIFADRAVSFDHATSTVTLTTVDGPAAAGWLADTRGRLEDLTGLPCPPPVGSATGRVGERAAGQWRHDDQTYLELIAKCQTTIARGDAYLLCLTNELRIDTKIEPLDAYLAVRRVSPTGHGGLLRFGAISLLSTSPEQFLCHTGTGIVTTRPIKGTRARGIDPVDDARVRAELLGSAKERAENLMIVDLMRNDLGRVARLGTVEVTSLFEVETYPQVHQLVSTVRARLADGLDALDVLRSCFPAGSMTGAPKLSAIRALYELERGPRGIYSGCFGLIAVDGSLDLSMVIRSIVLDDAGASIGAGGGITALSTPEEELAEVKLKADVLAAVVGCPV